MLLKKLKKQKFPKKILRMGIIGAGSFCVKRHIPEILKVNNEIKLVSISRRNNQKLKIIGKIFGIKSLYQNYLEMLKKEKLDLVLISSPHTLHYKHAKDSLRHNCHVIIEKPMTTNLKDAKKIFYYAKKKKRKIIPIFNPPFESHNKKLKELISRKKSFGNLEHVNLTWSDYKSPFFGEGKFIKEQLTKIMPTNFRSNKNLSAGGILFDSGCHLIAELIWIVNKNPIFVYSNFNNKKKELKLTLTLEFKNSVYANINIIGNSLFKKRRLESSYWGSKQLIRLTGKPYNISILNKNYKINNIKTFSNQVTPVKQAINYIKNKSKLEIGLKNSLSIISIIEHAYKSAKSHQKEKIIY